MTDVVNQLEKSQVLSKQSAEPLKVVIKSLPEDQNIHTQSMQPLLEVKTSNTSNYENTKELHIVIDCKNNATNNHNLCPFLDNLELQHLIVLNETVDKNHQNNVVNNQFRNVHSLNELITNNNKQENQVKSHQGLNLNSLKHLVNQFPNHVIEIQMEMTDSPPAKPFSNVRLVSNRHKPLVKLVRTDERSELEFPDTESRPLMPMMSTGITDFDDRPVYMKDLKEVMYAFENKLKVTRTTEKPRNLSRLSRNNLWALIGRNNENETEKESAPQGTGNEDNLKLSKSNRPSQVKDINDVLGLIKKGVKVQFDITKPTDNNLDWIQIKVPNKGSD